MQIWPSTESIELLHMLVWGTGCSVTELLEIDSSCHYIIILQIMPMNITIWFEIRPIIVLQAKHTVLSVMEGMPKEWL